MLLLEEARQKIHAAKHLTALTGSGISAESGIPTFRGADGLWKGFSAMELASPAGFAANPKTVWEWYNWRRQQVGQAQPNAGHRALTKLQLQKNLNLITQNVDRLHQRAGAKEVIELHGNIWDVLCTECGARYDKFNVTLSNDPKSRCCQALVRPGVVWFDEALNPQDVARSQTLSEQAEIFLVIGTSSVVYPAAGLTQIAKSCGAFVIEINIEATPASDIADITLKGRAGEILPKLV